MIGGPGALLDQCDRWPLSPAALRFQLVALRFVSWRAATLPTRPSPRTPPPRESGSVPCRAPGCTSGRSADSKHPKL